VPVREIPTEAYYRTEGDWRRNKLERNGGSDKEEACFSLQMFARSSIDDGIQLILFLT